MPTNLELLRELNQLLDANSNDRAAIARLKQATTRLQPIERIAVMEADVRKRDRRIQEIKKGK